MKKIKFSITVIMSVAITVLSVKALNATPASGGYIDSVNGFAIFEFQNGVSLAVKSDDINIGFREDDGLRGKLYIVSPNGRSLISNKIFKDRMGRVVSLPRDNYDKIVLLDKYGNLKGLIGATRAEARYFLKNDYIAVSDIVADPRYLIEGVREASNVLREAKDMSAEDQKELFIAAMNMQAGKKTADIVSGLLDLSDDNIQISESISELFESVAQGGDGTGGTSLVSQGGDGTGGTSLVAQGGDGTGGTSSVAQGGDGTGGTSSVAQGGDGTGGTSLIGAVVKGGNMEHDIQLPRVINLDAICGGLAIFF